MATNGYFDLRLYEDKEQLSVGIAESFLKVVFDLQKTQKLQHISLEGGRVCELSLGQIRDRQKNFNIDWSRVHFWWSDDRFLPSGDQDRNVEQAKRSLFCRIPLPTKNIHSIPASNEGLSLAQAAKVYASELASWASPVDSGILAPRFDVCLLGMGPDGHTASLFPRFEQVRNQTDTVLPVTDSPKPPPERITLTYRVINSSQRVWVEVAGSAKSVALRLALEGADPFEVPVSGVRGRLETVVFADKDANYLVGER